MKTLYPAISPYKTQRIKVDAIHELYIEECGNPSGIPVIFLHGGPGGGISEKHRRFFDPKIYHIILFDQRGCGKSTPYGCLENNTTQHLLSDIEVIRKQLQIEKWLVFGGSWGATLALLYAQAHPECVTGLILRGVWTMDKWALDWFPLKGARIIYPDYYEDYVKPIPEAERGNLVEAYYKRLCDKDPKISIEAAKAWAIWEGRAEDLITNADTVAEFGDPAMAVAIAKLECHYMINHGFITEGQILADMQKIAHIPGMIVHGRYDMICPIAMAWDVHKKWPASKLNIIQNAAHNAFEPGIIDGLISATIEMAANIKG